MTDLRNAIMARLWGLEFFEVGHATDTVLSTIEDEGYVIVKRRWWHRTWFTPKQPRQCHHNWDE